MSRILNAFLVRFERVGDSTRQNVDGILSIFSVMGSAIYLAFQPRTWSRPVRQVFVRQVLYTAVDAWWLAIRLSFALGVLVVVQTEMWGQAIADADTVLQPFLYHGLVRELAPLVANLIVIGRSGTAMSIEMATMTLDREIEVLESQGIDIMTYLITPRVISMALSVFLLAVIVTLAIPIFGFAIAYVLGFVSFGPDRLLTNISGILEPEDAVFFVAKTLLLGLMLGSICVNSGLAVRRAATEIPIAATRAAVHGLTALFVLSAILSVIVYGRLLLIPLNQIF